MQYNGKGVVVSFDLIVENLRRYYSEKSPQGAYAVIANEFESHGFEKLKDSDYRHNTMSKKDAAKLIADFSQKEKWFPASISKVIISPNVPQLEVTNEIKGLYSDVDWINEKDKEYAEKQAKKDKGDKGDTWTDWKKEIAKEKAQDGGVKSGTEKIQTKTVKER